MKLAAFLDPTTVRFLDNEELSYAVRELKSLYPNRSNRTQIQVSNEESDDLDELNGLKAFALKSGKHKNFNFVSME